jgi:hypothetical protein
MIDLRAIPNQTVEQCLASVRRDGMTLEWVDAQTFEICLAAVTQNGLALQFVEHQTAAICEVSELTPTVCLIACKQDTCAFGYFDLDALPECDEKEDLKNLHMIAILSIKERLYDTSTK